MSTDLNDIFGDEIVAYAQNRQADREFTGFAGAHGLTSMLYGSRGNEITVRGIVRGTGDDYAAARANAESQMAAIEACQWLQAADYSFKEETYYSVVWNKVEKIPDGNGSVFRMTSKGEVLVQFIIHGQALT